MSNVLKTILSKDNQTIKDALKLKEVKYQKQNNQVLVEGWNIVLEAIKNNLVDVVFCLEKDLKKISENCDIILINEEVAKKLSDVETSQNVFAILNLKKSELDLARNVLILDKVQDPGNLGTLIRSAAAFGFQNIVLGTGTVSPYNPKVIRSAQGLIFQVNLIQDDILNVINSLKDYEILMTNLHDDAIDYKKVTNKTNVALVLGNEGVGISQQILAIPHQNIVVKTSEIVESLNVAVAGSIIMSEIWSL
jgi:TrmH family RNA methyltransferase